MKILFMYIYNILILTLLFKDLVGASICREIFSIFNINMHLIVGNKSSKERNEGRSY